MPKPLRFHWRLPLAGEEPGASRLLPAGTPASALPDVPAHLEFCRLAEAHGIDSLLMACGFYLPDPVPVVAALSRATEKIRFLLAYRPGLLSPTAFVQQVNTLSALSGGRLALNVVMGHSAAEQTTYGDFLSHDERYERAGEFLEVCRAFWRPIGEGNGEVDFAGTYFRIEQGRLKTPFVAPDRQAPEIYLGGGSPPALELAARHGDCWLRLGDTPGNVREQVRWVRERGVEAGMRLSMVARPTREEAVAAAYGLLEGGDREWVRRTFVQGSDSAGVRSAIALEGEGSHWPEPYLWTGAVASRGASAVCLVGTPDEIAGAILDYAGAGVTQFIFSGWPNSAALSYFGAEILPRVRAREKEVD